MLDSVEFEGWKIDTSTKQEMEDYNINIERNYALISGIIQEEFRYNHEVGEEEFYKTTVAVARKSGTEDYIPVIASKKLVDNFPKGTLKGKFIDVSGQIRSYNRTDMNNDKHVNVFIFALYMNVREEEKEQKIENKINTIYLDGYICKPPSYRRTPLGRYITDLCLAVPRHYQKKDYIPCIAWGSTARHVGDLEMGTRIMLYGRVQSRTYYKRETSGAEQGKYITVYEVSIITVKEVKE